MKGSSAPGFKLNFNNIALSPALTPFSFTLQTPIYSPPIISLYNLTVSGMGLAFSSASKRDCNSA